MSATDQIRARVDRNRYVVRGTVGVSAPVPLTVQEVEALCDVADHAAALIESGVHDDDGDAIAIRAALARLDGEARR